MSKLQPVRGTHDLLPETAARFRHIEQTCFSIAQRYGYGEIRTPIFEFTSVFSRTLGETADIVSKEMYVFNDRSDESLCLRPEGTAAVARSFISEGLAQRLPLKLFYTGPMFRYERPQKGRQRQFYQIGAEFFGVDKPQADIELITMANDMLSELGLDGKYKLEINSLGDQQSRENYRKAFLDYLEPLKGDLSEDSQNRLLKNPLRILDSKDKGDIQIVSGAPKYRDHLSAASSDYFESVLTGLESAGIALERNDQLVRGLDYYDHVVFEFTTDLLGSQNALLSGGRYNGLVKKMGGKDTPAVGFAAGIERLEMLLAEATDLKCERPIAVIPGCESAEKVAIQIAHRLRQKGCVVEMGYSGNMTKRLKRANKLNARSAVIIAEDEVANNTLTIKYLDSGEQKTIQMDQIDHTLL